MDEKQMNWILEQIENLQREIDPLTTDSETYKEKMRALSSYYDILMKLESHVKDLEFKEREVSVKEAKVEYDKEAGVDRLKADMESGKKELILSWTKLVTGLVGVVGVILLEAKLKDGGTLIQGKAVSLFNSIRKSF